MNAQSILNELAEEWTRRANEYATLAADIDQGQFTRVTAQHRAEVYVLCAAEVMHRGSVIAALANVAVSHAPTDSRPPKP